ncbi:acyl-CoA dehydrogenase/oxidase [Hyaloraphidium curvatum]|nr:acyl-CoA dehydrogenase/oxidase [Hyaloraphidium curvatum]
MALVVADQLPFEVPPAKLAALKVYARSEVAQHNTPSSTWITIDSFIYDVTTFADLHPGGAHAIQQLAGKDATEQFYGLHRSEVLEKFGPRLIVGQVANELPKIPPRRVTKLEWSKVPYAETMDEREGFFPSPYYKDSHRALRCFMREFVELYVTPEAIERDDDPKGPTPELWKRCADAGIFLVRLGPGKHQHMAAELGFKLPCGIKPDELDYFHEKIVAEELSRTGAPGFFDALGTGILIGLPPTFNFGSPELARRVMKEAGSAPRPWIVATRANPFATEATAGSDVAGVQTTARLTEDGKHYIVNGHKKWITNGVRADYFSTAVRTDKGLTMMLIERQEGLDTKIMHTSYGTSAGTTYVTYENVKVPVENVLGKVNEGMKVVLSNFNHERWAILINHHRMCRVVLEECFKWAANRKVFGRPLVEQPVIQTKLAEMVGNIEADHALIEQLTWQMNAMDYAGMSEHLAGPIAIAKHKVTRTGYLVADHAVQIFGGRAITKNGMGRVIRAFFSAAKHSAVYGGSEEIMATLGIKQAMKKMPATAKL